MLQYTAMSDSSYPSTVTKRSRNPQTQAAHQRETLLQITLPLLIVLLAISQWADVSLIWLILLVCPWALIFLLILAGIAYGLAVLVKQAPGYFHQFHHFILVVQAHVNRYSDKAVEPIMRVKGLAASLDTLLGKMKIRK
jgi:uncharacterized membrane protein